MNINSLNNTKIIDENYWVDIRGRTHDITKMSDCHLTNVILFLLRSYNNNKNEVLLIKAEIMLRELMKRLILKDNSNPCLEIKLCP